MTPRYIFVAMAGIMLTCGLSVAPAHAQAHSAILPPDQDGLVTVVGCFVFGGENGNKHLLAGPTTAPIASVPEETCSVAVNSDALELEHTDKYGLSDSLIGRWIEVSGRLEKEMSDDPDNHRELHVQSFRVIPVIPPVAYVPPAPAPVIQQEPVAPPPEMSARQEEQPVATTGTEERKSLPKTGSLLPAIALAGLLSLAAAVALRLYGSHERG
jgi:hypothetical protein